MSSPTSTTNSQVNGVNANPAATAQDEGWPPWPPNQVGSGWNEDKTSLRPWDSSYLDPPGTEGARDTEGSQTTPSSPSTHAGDLAETYDALVAQVHRLAAAAAAAQDGSDSDSLPSQGSDESVDMLWFQAYLEFVMLQRGCAAYRSAAGLPSAPCTRHAPCPNCRLHDGSYVLSPFWQTMADETLELHLAQYLRIRDRLPSWSSTRAPGLAPPVLYPGQTASALPGPTPPSPSAPTSAVTPHVSLIDVASGSEVTVADVGADPSAREVLRGQFLGMLQAYRHGIPHQDSLWVATFERIRRVRAEIQQAAREFYDEGDDSGYDSDVPPLVDPDPSSDEDAGNVSDSSMFSM